MSDSHPDRSRVSLLWSSVLALIVAVAVGMTALAIHVVNAARQEPEPENIAGDAQRYLRFHKAVPLSEPLRDLLADPDLYVAESQPHPLIGKPAPGFRLPDRHSEPHSLEDYIAKGPVVLVFYYGYWCNHCVAQLFGLDEDLQRFAELDASILAVSPDAPEWTAQKFEEYGAFAFPTLSDQGNNVAATYGAYRPRNDDQAEGLQHGTFLIDRDGIVRWANLSGTPFLHNQTLLYRLAELEGQAPNDAEDSAEER